MECVPFILLSLLATGSCSTVEGSNEYYLRFSQWLEDYKGVIEKQELDPTEIYSNWLQNAKFVDQHNDAQYSINLNAFAYKVKLMHKYFVIYQCSENASSVS